MSVEPKSIEKTAPTPSEISTEELNRRKLFFFVIPENNRVAPKTAAQTAKIKKVSKYEPPIT